MKPPLLRLSALVPVLALMCAVPPAHAQDSDKEAVPITDPGWPRVFAKDGRKLTVYQPQVDQWDDYSKIHYRMAIEIEGVTDKGKFGVVEADANTLVDQTERTVVMYSTSREIRFANTPEAEADVLKKVIDDIVPVGNLMNFSLDRVLACLDPDQQSEQKPVDIDISPPPILHSSKPAILVMFMGDPQLKPVAKDRPDLMFAVNTNWNFFFDSASQTYFLLDEHSWLTAKEAKGPWTPAPKLPPALSELPDDENWVNVRENIPGKKAKETPVVFVQNQPSELIQTEGDPTYTPISGTRLLRVANTESTLFRDSADNQFYFLVAGRWFRAASLNGPWTAASSDLPEDFSRIPDGNPAAFVKCSVPGTPDAQDAVMLASVPASTTVDLEKPVTVPVEYQGEPRFEAIGTTGVQYAVNSAYTVLLVSGKYYCCDQGVWFTGSSASGPWGYSTTVPAEIYTIPPTSPVYNVTYVTVKSATPQTVVYNQTAGYSGEYVATNGVLMFGAGLLVGAIIADNHNDYCYPRPAYYSYGCGAVYHYGYGGYYGAARAAYGPYGGIAYGAAYNPRTGVYSRGVHAYGPYGSAGVRQAYNPYTGTYAAAGYRATPYGTVTAGRAYNPYTGATAAGGRVSTAYGSAGRGAAYNPSTGKAIAGGYRTGPNGSAGAVRTNQGTGAAAWDGKYSQGAVAKTKSGNIYAAKDGNVYKKDSDGWSQNNGNGWDKPSKPPAERPTPLPAKKPAQLPAKQPAKQPTQLPARPTTTTERSRTVERSKPKTPSYNRQSLEGQARSRERGAAQVQQSRSWQSQRSVDTSRSRGGSSGGRERSGRGR